MCIICIELEKDKLTPREAWRNLSEMQHSLQEDHLQEVVDKIWDKLHSRLTEGDDKEVDLLADMLDFTF
tara:strand:+ start:781 stop:987 length:207 start_codon:yes stop_codon:yes gene_type:complete